MKKLIFAIIIIVALVAAWNYRDRIQDIAGKADSAVSEVADEAKDIAGEVVDEAKEAVSEVTESPQP
jgi:predicted negative regulator of RcsB-dependent stress response